MSGQTRLALCSCLLCLCGIASVVLLPWGGEIAESGPSFAGSSLVRFGDKTVWHNGMHYGDGRLVAGAWVLSSAMHLAALIAVRSRALQRTTGVLAASAAFMVMLLVIRAAIIAGPSFLHDESASFGGPQLWASGAGFGITISFGIAVLTAVTSSCSAANRTRWH
jgi:hypothetical protein